MNSESRRFVSVDGNEAAAYVAHKLSEVIAIYPITPSSTMGELADQWTTEHIPNIWGSVPHVIEMQSEGSAAGAVYGEPRRPGCPRHGPQSRYILSSARSGQPLLRR